MSNNIESLGLLYEKITGQTLENKPSTIAEMLNLIAENCSGGGAMSTSAPAHNGIYRGINLLDKYTIEQLHEMVEVGDFSDIYIGDYIDVTISTSYKTDETVRLLVAHLDYFFGVGSTEWTNHHIVFVPEDCFVTTEKMNNTNTTVNGYIGSNMHTSILPIYYTALNGVDALNGHILTHSRYLSSEMTSEEIALGTKKTGATTKCAFTDTNLCLMNEAMVYGFAPYSSSALDTADANSQLALFKLAPHKRIAHLGYTSTSRTGWGLASVATSSYFCFCTVSGVVGYYDAGLPNGVRPYLLFG